MSDRQISKKDIHGQQSDRINAPESFSIDQHEMAFTDAASDKPVLWTQGIGPCVGMAVYNPQTKTAALAHVDFVTKLSSLAPVFNQLSRGSDAALEVHLVGGETNADVAALRKYIQSQNNVLIKSAHLSPPQGAKLAIDSRTGQVMTNFKTVGYYDLGDLVAKLDKLTEHCITTNFRPFPIDCVYDGRSRKDQPQTSPAKGPRLGP